jgi:hypothetical protein
MVTNVEYNSPQLFSFISNILLEVLNLTKFNIVFF